MKKSNFENVLLALIPTALMTPGFQPALSQSVCAVSAYWITACFFKGTRILFPGHLLETALILWLAVWVYLGEILWNLPVFWVISVFLLLPNRGVENSGWKAFLRTIVFQGGLFWGFSIALGAVKEVLFWRWQIPLFQSPAGFFLILLMPVYLWRSILAAREK